MLIEGIDLINHHIWYNTCRVIDGQESQLRHSWDIQSADLWTGSKSPETSCTTKRSNMFTFHFTQLGAGEPLHVGTVKCIVTGVLSQQLLHLLQPLLLILERLVISSCLFHYEGCFLMFLMLDNKLKFPPNLKSVNTDVAAPSFPLRISFTGHPVIYINVQRA